MGTTQLECKSLEVCGGNGGWMSLEVGDLDLGFLYDIETKYIVQNVSSVEDLLDEIDIDILTDYLEHRHGIEIKE